MANNQMMKIAQQIAERIIHKRMAFQTQMALDVAKITANEVLGLGPGRAAAFEEKYRQNMNELAAIVVEDSENDKKIWYSKEKLDNRIRAIDGDENFIPFDDRYFNI